MTRRQYSFVAGLLLLVVIIFMQTFPEGKSLTRQIFGFFEGLGALVGGIWAALLPIINVILTGIVLLVMIFLPPFAGGFIVRYVGVSLIDRIFSREQSMTSWQVWSLQGLVLFLGAFPWTKLVPSFRGLNVWFPSYLSVVGWLVPEIFPVVLYLLVLVAGIAGAWLAGNVASDNRYRR